MSESFARIEAHGENIELDRSNSSLYLHLGRLAIYDHLYVEHPQGGIYFWRHNEHFDSLLDGAVDAKCTVHFNLQEVSKADEDAYYSHAMADLGDYPPEGWD